MTKTSPTAHRAEIRRRLNPAYAAKVNKYMQSVAGPMGKGHTFVTAESLRAHFDATPFDAAVLKDGRATADGPLKPWLYGMLAEDYPGVVQAGPFIPSLDNHGAPDVDMVNEAKNEVPGTLYSLRDNYINGVLLYEGGDEYSAHEPVFVEAPVTPERIQRAVFDGVAADIVRTHAALVKFAAEKGWAMPAET